MIKKTLRRFRVPKWLIWLVIVAVVAVTAEYGYRWYWHMRMHGLVLFNWSMSTDTTPVEFTIVDRSFRIPNNLFFSRHHWQDGRESSFSLVFLLPDMVARTKENLKEFVRGGNRAALYVDVRDRDSGPDTHQRVINGARFEKEVPFGTEPPPGFNRRYVDLSGNHETYVVEVDGRFMYSLTCDWPNPNRNAQCKAHRDYSPGLTLGYNFSRDHLADWQVIDKQVMDKLKSLEITKARQE